MTITIANLVRASIGTRHFEFEAYGLGEAGARDVLRSALEQHAKEYRLYFDAEGLRAWVDSLLDDATFFAVGDGMAYRDREQLELPRRAGT